MKACVQYDARDAGSFIVLGQICARLHKNEEAAEHLRTGARLAPDNLLARTELGLVLLRLGDAAGAQSAYSEAKRLAPSDPSVTRLQRELESRGISIPR